MRFPTTGRVLAVLATSAMAAVPLNAQAPVQLAFVTPIQIVPETQAVKGIRIDLLYGSNTAMTGLDLGFVNRTTTGPSGGLEWGLVNLTGGRFTGVQIGFVNMGDANEGLQWGGFNSNKNMSGLQLGLVNYAERTHGVQVGLINIIQTGGQFPVFPIVNWGK